MGFVKDIFKGVGKVLKGIGKAVGKVFKAVGSAIKGLLKNPLLLIAAAGFAFFAAPAIGAMMSGLTSPTAAAAAGATAAVETVAGGAALGSMQSAVLGTGAEFIAGAAANSAASASLVGAGAGLLGETAGAAMTYMEPGSGFLGEAAAGWGSEPLLSSTNSIMAGGESLLGSGAGGAYSAGGMLYDIPTAGLQQAAQASSPGLLDSIIGGAKNFIKSPLDWMKSNKEIVSMIGNGIKGWQEEEMQQEYMDWKKQLAEQQQANWEATHQPYPFHQYDPGAAMQAMNAGIFNSGYLPQATQLQRAGYQPQYVVNQPYPYSMPNYERAVAATYGRQA
jgi:hypothetical protein